jgi:hypothetical protein
MMITNPDVEAVWKFPKVMACMSRVGGWRRIDESGFPFWWQTVDDTSA